MFMQPMYPNSLQYNLDQNYLLQYQQQESLQLMLNRQQFELNHHRTGNYLTSQDVNYRSHNINYRLPTVTTAPDIESKAVASFFKTAIELHNAALWELFNKETTEMIITKTGRRMFPPVEIILSGMDRQAKYCILLELSLASNNRQKYNKNSEGIDETDYNSFQQPVTKGWVSSSAIENDEPNQDRRIVLHPDSPACGSHWMQQHPISFGKVKITNDNSNGQQNQIVLKSMHKYVVRIWIAMCGDRYLDPNLYFKSPLAICTLKETEFIAVTAYQNKNIIHLKIENNPFAKGFRKDGQSRCKRKWLREIEEERNTEKKKCLSEKENDYSSEEEIDVISLTSHEQSRISTNDSFSIDSCNSRNDNEIPSNSLSNVPCTSTNNDENAQPQFHRPWIDRHEVDKSEVLVPSNNEPSINYSELRINQYLYGYIQNYLVCPLFN